MRTERHERHEHNRHADTCRCGEHRSARRAGHELGERARDRWQRATDEAEMSPTRGEGRRHRHAEAMMTAPVEREGRRHHRHHRDDAAPAREGNPRRRRMAHKLGEVQREVIEIRITERRIVRTTRAAGDERPHGGRGRGRHGEWGHRAGRMANRGWRDRHTEA